MKLTLLLFTLIAVLSTGESRAADNTRAHQNSGTPTQDPSTETPATRTPAGANEANEANQCLAAANRTEGQRIVELAVLDLMRSTDAAVSEALSEKELETKEERRKSRVAKAVASQLSPKAIEAAIWRRFPPECSRAEMKRILGSVTAPDITKHFAQAFQDRDSVAVPMNSDYYEALKRHLADSLPALVDQALLNLGK